MRFNRIFLFFLLLSLLLTSCEKVSALTNGTPTEEHEDFIGTLTFLGDSTTAHMISRAPITHKSQIWATKNRYLNLDPRITYTKIMVGEEGEELTIGEMAKKLQPKRLVLTLGVDYGVYYYQNDQKTFAFYYEKLIDTINLASPNTTVILQSIFPVAKSSTAITNKMIDRANQTIKEISERRALVYIDTNAHLKNAEGYLPPEYCSSADGIHLTNEAYKVIFDIIAQHENKIKEAE